MQYYTLKRHALSTHLDSVRRIAASDSFGNKHDNNADDASNAGSRRTGKILATSTFNIARVWKKKFNKTAIINMKHEQEPLTDGINIKSQMGKQTDR